MAPSNTNAAPRRRHGDPLSNSNSLNRSGGRNSATGRSPADTPTVSGGGGSASSPSTVNTNAAYTTGSSADTTYHVGSGDAVAAGSCTTPPEAAQTRGAASAPPPPYAAGSGPGVFAGIGPSAAAIHRRPPLPSSSPATSTTATSANTLASAMDTPETCTVTNATGTGTDRSSGTLHGNEGGLGLNTLALVTAALAMNSSDGEGGGSSLTPPRPTSFGGGSTGVSPPNAGNVDFSGRPAFGSVTAAGPLFISGADLRQFQPELPSTGTSLSYNTPHNFSDSRGTGTSDGSRHHNGAGAAEMAALGTSPHSQQPSREAIAHSFRELLGPVQTPSAAAVAALSYAVSNNDALGTGGRVAVGAPRCGPPAANGSSSHSSGCCLPPSAASSLSSGAAQRNASATGVGSAPLPNNNSNSSSSPTTLDHSGAPSVISAGGPNASSHGSSLPNAVHMLAARGGSNSHSSTGATVNSSSELQQQQRRTSTEDEASNAGAARAGGGSSSNVPLAAPPSVSGGGGEAASHSSHSNTEGGIVNVSAATYTSAAEGGDGDVIVVPATEDQLCYLRTVESFRQYQQKATAALQLRRAHFAGLSDGYRSLLGFDADERIFGPYAVGIRENQRFALGICRAARRLFSGYWPSAPVPAYFDHPDFVPPPGEEETDSDDEEEEEDEEEGDDNESDHPSNAADGDNALDPQARYKKDAAARAAAADGRPDDGPNNESDNAAGPAAEGPQRRRKRVLGYSLEAIAPTVSDTEKVFSTLRQCVRDWSDVGAEERSAVYGPIIAALTHYFPTVAQRQRTNVLVPGAGLSRLSVELALLGFNAFGNEFSYHMLIAGHFVMNGARCRGQFVMYPYVDTTLNLVRRSDQLCPAAVPDLCAADCAEGLLGSLSMVAGDFMDVYSRPAERGQWACVVSCFFIDTAHNVLDYLTCIYECLAPGGLLVNLGPLLYHFADSAGSPSIELSLDELLHAAGRVGFVPLAPVRLLPTTYTNNALSMKQMVYQSAFFVLQKPAAATNASATSAASSQPAPSGAEKA